MAELNLKQIIDKLNTEQITERARPRQKTNLLIRLSINIRVLCHFPGCGE